MPTNISFTPHAPPTLTGVKLADVKLSIPDAGAVLVLFTEKGPALRETVSAERMHLVLDLLEKLADLK